MKRKFALAAGLAALLVATTGCSQVAPGFGRMESYAQAAPSQEYGPGPGYGPGYGPGPGMMGGWGYGPGYDPERGWGPGMMGGYGPGMMGGGWGPGYGPGMMGGGWGPGYGGGYGPGMMGGWGRGGGIGWLPDLSREQREKIAGIQRDYASKQWPLMQQMHSLMWASGAPGTGADDQAERQNYDAVAALRKQMFDNMLAERKAIDAVLTPQQRDELRGRRPRGR
jgi:Spy/CpxP family protein refolding chaperone